MVKVENHLKASPERLRRLMAKRFLKKQWATQLDIPLPSWSYCKTYYIPKKLFSSDNS